MAGKPTYTLDELSAIVGFRFDKPRYSLEEVAEMFEIPVESLKQDARDGRIEHVHRGRQRFMTPAQIVALIVQCTVKVSDPRRPRVTRTEVDAEERDRRRIAARNSRAKAA